ncbi:MAG: hypothetical protein ACQET7_13465 [Thermodesulfobacteriota bacterium]
MTRQHQFGIDNLSSILVYVLGHRPDEFGLVPDIDGFITIKRLLQALREEPEWSHVREGLLREVLVSEKRELFDCQGPLIRTRERRFSLDLENPVSPPSGMVFSPIRKRAHPHVLEHGLEPRPDGPHILTMDQDMAMRIGRRTDPSPVILEIHIPARGEGAVPVYSFGGLFLAPQIPSEDIVGPPLSKDRRKDLDKPEKAAPKKEMPAPKGRDFEAGTFFLDPDRDPDPFRKAARGRKRRTWKENARRLRREK